MRILLLKQTLIGKRSYAQGDTAECDDTRAKYLILHGRALRVKVTRPVAPEVADGDGEGEGDGPPKREAVVKPKSRKAILDV